MDRPFVIVALPRSGTAWLSRVLTVGGWTCWHQSAIHMRDVADIAAFLRQPRTGSAETAVALGWRIIRHHVPEARIVVVRRPVADSAASMLRVDTGGHRYDPADLLFGLTREARALDELSEQPGVLTVPFADLWREDAGAAIFAHCLPVPFDRERWAAFRELNIQCDVKGMLAYYQVNREAVTEFKVACKRELFRLARAGEFMRMAA